MTHPAIVDIRAEYPNADLDPHWIETNRDRAEARLSAVPHRFAEALPDDPTVISWVQDLVGHAVVNQRAFNPRVSTGPSLLILGNVGTGKTFQAYGAVRALAHSGISCPWLFTTAADLYADLRPRDRGQAADFDRYADTALLVLDDLGAAKASEWNEEINYRLINHRYDRELPTIVTSNLGPRDLAGVIGERVASRLAEMAVARA
jgi:DNA replication protein DnaC